MLLGTLARHHIVKALKKAAWVAGGLFDAYLQVVIRALLIWHPLNAKRPSY